MSTQFDHIENMSSIGRDSTVMENNMSEDHYNNWPNDKGVSEIMDASNYSY